MLVSVRVFPHFPSKMHWKHFYKRIICRTWHLSLSQLLKVRHFHVNGLLCSGYRSFVKKTAIAKNNDSKSSVCLQLQDEPFQISHIRNDDYDHSWLRLWLTFIIYICLVMFPMSYNTFFFPNGTSLSSNEVKS